MNDNDRRVQDRRNLKIPVQFWLDDSPDKHRGMLIDLSDQGAFIETIETLPLWSIIQIVGEHVDIDAEIIRVYWLSPDEYGARKTGIAVKYRYKRRLPSQRLLRLVQ